MYYKFLCSQTANVSPKGLADSVSVMGWLEVVNDAFLSLLLPVCEVSANCKSNTFYFIF
jgi:hypothetical protein